jgi:ribA/ribD-fused uncharacterized protein
MATDTGVRILSVEGKLRREAGGIFQALLGGDTGDIEHAILLQRLEEFGFSDDDGAGIMAVLKARGGVVGEAAFSDAYVAVKGAGQQTEGVDLTSVLVHSYYNQAGEPLSNFFPCVPGIEIGGASFPTVEHYYQFSKHAQGDPALAERIRTSSLSDAHNLGGQAPSLRADWDHVRDDVYYTGMLAKFTQHAELRSVLIATGDKTLVQVDSDRHWGMCVPDDLPGGLAYGENAGGRALQRVRDNLNVLASQ